MCMLLSFTSDNDYDSLIQISTTKYNTDKFIVLTMKRDGNRVKAKYFAATDPNNGQSVQQRYKSWSLGKRIICFSSGTYMNSCDQVDSPTPVGLCIDNGVIVNKNLQNDIGGLVIVRATGGIVTTRLSDGDLSIQGNFGSKTVDIKKNTFDKIQFIKWAEENEATVFQAHLLVYKDKLDINYCSSANCLKPASRRFLAAGKDQDGNLVHIIIHCTTETTLYQGAVKVFNFLKDFRDMKEVTYMVNLDTGCQNVFKLYKSDGTEKSINVVGQNYFYPIDQAVNLLVYYYE